MIDEDGMGWWWGGWRCGGWGVENLVLKEKKKTVQFVGVASWCRHIYNDRSTTAEPAACGCVCVWVVRKNGYGMGANRLRQCKNKKRRSSDNGTNKKIEVRL